MLMVMYDEEMVECFVYCILIMWDGCFEWLYEVNVIFGEG